MRFFPVIALGLLLASLPARADSLVPGKAFPAITLPPIDGGDPVATNSLFGDKLMLHLFASW